MPRRIEIDPVVLQTRTATSIAKTTGISIRTILRRQREAGVEIRPQGVRDYPIPMLVGFDGSHWMNAAPQPITRSRWT